MPPELPNNQHALPRSRVVEVIERSQEDAMRQLRQAGVPETQALVVMGRIHTFCLQTLEVAISSLVTAAIDKLKDEYKRQYLQPREVITTVPVRPRPPAWQQTLQDLWNTHPWLFVLVGLGLWFLLWWLVTTSLTWAVIAVGITAFIVWLFAKPGLWFIGIVGLLFLLILVF
jgi:hypothetical protein